MTTTLDTTHRFSLGEDHASTTVEVGVAVMWPNEPAGGVGFGLECSQELEFEFEDRIWGRVKAAVLRTIQSAIGSVPPGGVAVRVRLVLPDDWQRIAEALPAIAAHFAAEAVKTALTAPRAL